MPDSASKWSSSATATAADGAIRGGLRWRLLQSVECFLELPSAGLLRCCPEHFFWVVTQATWLMFS